MVKVGGSQGMGPDLRPTEYKGSAYKHNPDGGYKYTGYKSEYNDTVRNRGTYKPSEGFKPTESKYDYKSYKPSHVGIYGEKEREKKIYKKPEKPQPKPYVRKPARTFESYKGPRGPDIRTDGMGPEYKTKDYNFTSYKPGTPIKPTKYGGDTIKAQPMYTDNERHVYKPGSAAKYKLNEDNYGGMRHFKYGFIDDPVVAHKSDEPPREKPKIKKDPPKPKPATKKPEEPKLVPAVVPVHKKPATPPPVLPPIVAGPKTFKSTGTQHIPPDTNTIPTQTQLVTTKATHTQYVAPQTKAMSIQTDRYSPSPKPAVLPLVMSGNKSPVKVKTKSAGIQCSEPQKKVMVRGTQYDAPSLRATNTQTSPMIFAPPPQVVPIQARNRSPEYVREVREETPVYRAPAQRRSPSPRIVPIVAVAASRRSPTPVVKREPTPVSNYKAPPEEPKVRSPSPKRYSPPPVVYKEPTPIMARQPTPRTPPQKTRTPTPPKQYSPPPIVYMQPIPVMARQPTPKTPPQKTRTPTPPKQASPIKSAATSRWTPSPEPFIAPVPAPVRQLPPVVPVQPSPRTPSPKPINKKNPSPVFAHPAPEPKSPTPPLRPSPKSQAPKSKSPKVFISPRMKTPPQAVNAASTKSHLPPEVTAYIEAYNTAHGPETSGTVKTMQRSMAV